jgi:hypothetical protein
MVPEHLLEGGHQLANGHAVSGADVEDRTHIVDPVQHVVERLDRRHVCLRQVPHVHIVADPRAVTGWVLSAGYRERINLAQGSHRQLAEDVRGLAGVDTRLELGVGSDRVEVA